MTPEEELAMLEEQAKSMGIDPSSITPDEYGSPTASVKDNIFRFFREILKLEDTTKFGNLTDQELGRAKQGVRDLKSIALFADSQGLDEVAKYLKDEAEIMTSTSMSRKGWFGNLTVTQIKKEQKISGQPIQKKGWFSSTPKQEEQDV